jgi:hypothetical protein
MNKKTARPSIIMAMTIALTLLCVPAAAQKIIIKNVAVIETEIDAQSGAADEIGKPDARQITTVLRREAVRYLPRDRYNVMTSETVQSMGDAVLEECAEENCVITLGSKIGADYIVRGIISKFQGRLALDIEIFETEYGNLIASSDPIHAANIAEMYEKSATACAAMYQNFVGPLPKAADPAPISTAVAIPSDPNQPIPTEPTARKTQKPSFWIGVGAEAVGAGIFIYGISQHGQASSINNDKNNVNRFSEATDAKNRGNTAYIVGAALLLSGISIHIFF